MLNAGSAGSFAIGLWGYSENKEAPLNSFFTKGENQGYAYRINDGRKSRSEDGFCYDKFGIAVKTGDMIKMILDFDNLSLCWEVNEKSIGKSHDITRGKYKAAMYMGNKEKIVEIIP